MSDVKGVDPKPADPAAAAPPAPAAKPADPAPAPAAPKPEAAKVEHAKPAAPAAAPAKPAEAPKPAPAAAPVAAAAAPAGPAPGTVGVRAPAAKTAEQNLQITISTKAIAYIMSALVLTVVILGGTTIFLLMRLVDKNPLARVTDQVPGMEGPGYAVQPKAAAPDATAKAANPEPSVSFESIEIGVNFKDGLGGKPSSLPGSWPCFRGPDYDFIAKGVSLANKWPKDGPPVKWKITGLGEGYSGAAVHAGRVYIQDYEPETKEESLRCFSLDDGKEIWKRSYVMPIGNSHGFTRTVPAVTDKYAVVYGAMSHVMCVDAQTGALKWTINMMKEYGTQTMKELWYASQCPIIDGNVTVLAPCGKDVLMIGVDLETGKVVWKTPNPGKLNLAHSSITPMTLNGKKQYVYCAERGKMVGVSAEKGSEGALLWEASWSDQQVMSPSPVILEDGHIFMTAGVGAGSVLLKVSEQGGKYDAKIVWKMTDKETLACEQQTPIYFEKHLYALNVRSGGGRQDQLLCMSPFEKGKVLWESGNQKKFGYYEPTLLADGKFYVVGKDCSLTMVKATTKGYEELGRCKLLDGKEPWGPIALAGNLMIFRDSKVMICIDVGKGIE